MTRSGEVRKYVREDLIGELAPYGFAPSPAGPSRVCDNGDIQGFEYQSIVLDRDRAVVSFVALVLPRPWAEFQHYLAGDERSDGPVSRQWDGTGLFRGGVRNRDRSDPVAHMLIEAEAAMVAALPPGQPHTASGSSDMWSWRLGDPSDRARAARRFITQIKDTVLPELDRLSVRTAQVSYVVPPYGSGWSVCADRTLAAAVLLSDFGPSARLSEACAGLEPQTQDWIRARARDRAPKAATPDVDAH